MAEKRKVSHCEDDVAGPSSVSDKHSKKSKKERKKVCIIHCKQSNSAMFTWIYELDDPKDRIHLLRNIATDRLSQPIDSPYRMDEICKQIPINFEDEHGYHRDCY